MIGAKNSLLASSLETDLWLATDLALMGERGVVGIVLALVRVTFPPPPSSVTSGSSSIMASTLMFKLWRDDREYRRCRTPPVPDLKPI